MVKMKRLPPAIRFIVPTMIVLLGAYLVGVMLVHAQVNPVVNGDFETGDLTGWTVFTTANGTLGAGYPQVILFDTNGDGTETYSAKFQAGRSSNGGRHEGGGIFQDINLSAGEYTVSANAIAADAGTLFGNGSAGRFELLVDGVVVAKHNFGAINPGKTLRADLTGFVTVAEGTHEIRFRITRPYTQNAITPTQFIDNVEIVYEGGAQGAGQPPAPPPTSGEFLLIDADTIDSGIKSIEAISFNSPHCGGGDPVECVNDDIADPAVRAFLFSDILGFSGLTLPTGAVGDEGLFTLTAVDPQTSLQGTPSFTTAELIAAAGAAADENNLDKVVGVVPLGAADIAALQGRTFCALVYDSHISAEPGDPSDPTNPPNASLKGATNGLTAFTVTAVGPDPDGSGLPSITIDLHPDPYTVCGLTHLTTEEDEED